MINKSTEKGKHNICLTTQLTTQDCYSTTLRAECSFANMGIPIHNFFGEFALPYSLTLFRRLADVIRDMNQTMWHSIQYICTNYVVKYLFLDAKLLENTL